MNKNDLRFRKTEMAIKEAYLALKKNGKPVKVKDLCEKAMINKTTFYSHYETIDSIKEQVCSELILKMLEDCPHINDFFNDTNSFVNEIHSVFVKNKKIILELYDDDVNALVNDIESELLKNYISNDITVDMELAIRFCIGGAFRLLIVSHDQEYVSKAVYLIEKIVESLSDISPDSL